MMKFIRLAGILCLIVAMVLAVKKIVQFHIKVEDGLIQIAHDYDKEIFSEEYAKDMLSKGYVSEWDGQKGYKAPADTSPLNRYDFRDKVEDMKCNVMESVQDGSGRLISDYPDAGTDEKTPDEAKPSQNGMEDGSGAKTPQHIITLDELKSFEKIKLSDKMTGLVIASKIKKKDLDRLIEIAKSGVTLSELDTVKSILYDNLEQKDIDRLYRIFARNKSLLNENTVDAIVSSLNLEIN